MKSLQLAPAILVLLSGAASRCFGEGDSSLSDPTRPPIVATETAPAGTEGVPPSSGLQTIIIGKGHKPMAVINGTTVQIGDKVGEATLVKLSETQAVLQGPSGKEILFLTPGVVKMYSRKQERGTDQKRGSATATRVGPISDGMNHDK